MDESPNIVSAAAVHEFLARYLADREVGETVALESYLALFPGHEGEIAHKYRELQVELPPTAPQGVEESPPAERCARERPEDDPGIDLMGAFEDGFAPEVVRRLAGRVQPCARYERGEEIARGGQGVVLRVWDADLRRSLAMKVLRERDESTDRAPGAHPRSLGRFLEEAQVTGQLDHPGIVPVHELGLDEDGRVYFTMRLVEGRDLKAVFGLVRDGRDDWTRTRALNVMLKVCEAMAFAHSKGVMHRDLKPANVMVGPFGEVYVMDWGLARVVDRSDGRDVRIRPEPPRASGDRSGSGDIASPLVTMDGDVVGTPAYMSPEQAQGELDAMGPHSDVYAAGAMLYHLLSGEMPYARPGSRLDSHAIWYRVQKGPPAPLHELAPDASAELVAICEKAMARDVGARYADMTELAEDLRSYLEHRVVAAYETGAWAEARKWVARNKPLATAMASVVVLLAVGLVATWLLKAESDANAERARENEQLARAETAKVLRLRDVKKLEDVLDEVDEQWPLGPERIPELESWLARARELTANLPLHTRILLEMRARALPWSAEDSERDRTTDPRFAELDHLTRRLRGLRRARALDCGEEAPVLAGERGDEWPSLGLDPKPALWKWVDPERTVFGREALGLALALDEVRDRPWSAGLRKTLAWALFANGRFDEAAAESAEALRLVGADGESDSAEDLQRLAESIASTRDGSLLNELEREIDALEAELGTRRSWRFETEGEQWHHDVLGELIVDLEELASGLLAEDALVEGRGPSVPIRLAFAREMGSGFAEGGEYRRAWARALPAIRASYGGLELPPQMGLAPLGPDPESGLWEFAHLLTGEPAERSASGELALTEETGLVLVLLQGGTFSMGAQSTDPSGPNYDPLADDRNEAPVHELELSPFFMSKYEMTQGQWKRLTGRNPSQVGPDRAWHESWSSSGGPASHLHPVERVSRVDCRKWLPRAGLALPTEAQWEYAARGGTDTPWWTGGERGSLQGAANLADRHMKEHRRNWTGYDELEYELWLDDGFSFHAPVGTYAPNDFGLYEVAGNLREWVEDAYYEKFYQWSPARDPVRTGGSYFLSRGGSHVSDASNARSADRHTIADEARRHGLGVRPARAIDR